MTYKPAFDTLTRKPMTSDVPGAITGVYLPCVLGAATTISAAIIDACYSFPLNPIAWPSSQASLSKTPAYF